MPRIVVNGDPAIRELRLNAYPYVELRPKVSKLAIQCPEGVEVHMPDGSINSVNVPCWVIEQPDGTVHVLRDEHVRAEYDVDDDAEPVSEVPEGFAQARAEITEALTPDSVENPSDDVAEELNLESAKALDIPGANRDFQQTDPDNPGEPLTPARKAEIQAGFRAEVEKAAAELAEASGKAQQAGLITGHEADAWRATGVAPERVTVSRSTDGQLVVSRAPQGDLQEAVGDEDAEDEGSPEIEVAQLSSEDLGAVLRNDADAFPRAGEVVVPEAIEELQERAATGDEAAQAQLAAAGLDAGLPQGQEGDQGADAPTPSPSDDEDDQGAPAE